MPIFAHFPQNAVRNVNVWAGHAELANLRPSPGSYLKGLKYPDGDRRGQGGWDVSLGFRSLEDLASKLKNGVKVPELFYPGDVSARDAPPIRRGEISRLAIMVHGQQGGELLVDGQYGTRTLKAETVTAFHPALHSIGLYTKPDISTILLMGCLAGQGDAGTRLLEALSRIWRGRYVVGFTTIGYRHPGEMTPRPIDDPFELPGMRDTDATSGTFVNRNELDRLWLNLAKMPWASEYSPHAKIVRNGAMIKCPPGDMCNVPFAPGQRKR